MVKVRSVRPNLERGMGADLYGGEQKVSLGKTNGFKKTKLKIRTSVVIFISAV